jgi:hypothetical protein
MKIDVSQSIGVPRDRIAEAFVDPAWYASMETRPSVSPPEPLSLSSRDGVVRTSVRWRYAGTLPAVAARLLDPTKMTWVIEMRLSLDSWEGTLHVVPDHYEGLLTFEGDVAFETAATGTLERVAGELTVKIPVFVDAVEQAIATGFAAHLGVEAQALERYCG